MGQNQESRQRASLEIRNIGGISETTVELTPGITILAGRNATNRTSLLRSLMTALGSENVTLKGDADEGYVELSVGERTYTRRIRRNNGTITTEGDPYLDDPTLADLFAFLLESNEARRGIEQGNDLREVIMRPVDTAEIEADIDRLKEERQQIEDRMDELDSLKNKLPDLEDRRNDLESEIEEKRDELAELEADIEEFDTDVNEQREEQVELENKLDELSAVRSELESVRQKLDSERQSIESLEAERDELDQEQDEHPTVSEDRIEGITAEVTRLRQEISTIESTVNELQTVIQFNENIIEDDVDFFSQFRDEDQEDDLTDQLLAEGEDLACWTCGSDVDTAQIESMVDQLREFRNDKMNERNALRSEIEELETERKELRDRKRKREEIADRLDRVDQEIGEREGTIDELNERKHELTNNVETLESAVEELRTDDQSELLDLHKEANRLDIEIERLEEDLQTVENEIARIEDELENREQLEVQQEELTEEIESLRTRVEQLEKQAVEEFNEHMHTILNILEYENLERIWIEQTERNVRDGRRNVTESYYDLHVVRMTESETMYEDTVEHLSESEREVTGLVFALAGYLVHEVYEDLPYILLDSVEALDSERIATLIEYFESFSDYFVVALLEEDASALDDDYQRITDI